MTVGRIYGSGHERFRPGCVGGARGPPRAAGRPPTQDAPALRRGAPTRALRDRVRRPRRRHPAPDRGASDPRAAWAGDDARARRAPRRRPQQRHPARRPAHQPTAGRAPHRPRRPPPGLDRRHAPGRAPHLPLRRGQARDRPHPRRRAHRRRAGDLRRPAREARRRPPHPRRQRIEGRTAVTRIFATLGRFSVRFRYPVVALWIAATVLSVHFFPGLSSVAKDTNSGFLPADTPSMQASKLATPFQNSDQASLTVVVSRSGGSLSAADQQTVTQVEAAVGRVAKVTPGHDLGASRDCAAEQALVQADVAPYGNGSDQQAVVSSIRKILADHSIGGLTFNLTGELPIVVDTQQQQTSSRSSTQGLSFLFTIVLLLFAFRALLAPLVTLLPAALVLFLASPVIAAATHLGVQVSSITQFLLVVLVLGAGTDYGLFLVFRVREELRRGLDPKEAVVRAVTTVGESVTFSALTVIAALMSLVLAKFGFYQSMGPALAIGIALMLLAGLTLLPALLAIFRRAVFWPSRTRLVERPRTTIYGRIAGAVVRRPLAVAAFGVLGFAALAAGSLSSSTAGFADQSSGPPRSDSADGSTALPAHHPAAPNPPIVLLQFAQPVWDNLGAISTAEQALRASGQVGRVVGPLDPAGLALSPAYVSGLPAQPRDLPLPLAPTPPADSAVSAADY